MFFAALNENDYAAIGILLPLLFFLVVGVGVVYVIAKAFEKPSTALSLSIGNGGRISSAEEYSCRKNAMLVALLVAVAVEAISFFLNFGPAHVWFNGMLNYFFPLVAKDSGINLLFQNGILFLILYWVSARICTSRSNGSREQLGEPDV